MVNLRTEYARDVCGLGQEVFACSFLALGAEGFVCLKCSEMEDVIWKRRSENGMTALGVNCSGPPDFIVTEETVN